MSLTFRSSPLLLVFSCFLYFSFQCSPPPVRTPLSPSLPHPTIYPPFSLSFNRQYLFPSVISLTSQSILSCFIRFLLFHSPLSTHLSLLFQSSMAMMTYRWWIIIDDNDMSGCQTSSLSRQIAHHYSLSFAVALCHSMSSSRGRNDKFWERVKKMIRFSGYFRRRCIITWV